MKSATLSIQVLSDRRHQFTDLTDELRRAVKDAGVTTGAAIVFCAHTTAALLINEWEDGAMEDLTKRLEALVPGDVYYAHDDMTRRTQNLAESHERANGQAHVTNMILGATSHAIPVAGGEPLFGRWQRLLMLELDEPKEREILVHVFGEGTVRERGRRGTAEDAEGDMVGQRRQTRQIRIGSVPVGGGAPVSVQSMTTTKTADVNATLQQIASLVAAGVDIVRVAVPHWEDARALTAIAAKSTVPVVADIHFQWKYAMAALEAGVQGLRINPGNIKYQDKVRLIAREARARGVPIRIGVNAGSLESDLLAKYGRPTPEALVESALNEARILEDEDFFDIKISVKHSSPRTMIEAYRMLAEKCDYPLHLGVTEAGPMPAGGVKSAVGIGALLAEGVGDTIRVSLTDDPVEEVKVGTWILQSLGLRTRGLDLVACPSCGRAEVNVLELTRKVNEALERAAIKVPLRVAVMGCVVNGPGEAREADLGIASGNGFGHLIVRGEVKGKVPEDRIVDVLVEEARRLAAEKERELAEAGGGVHAE